MAKDRAIIQNNLATVECLGITPTHIRLDSTNPEEGSKGFFGEPRPVPLAGETIENFLNLSLGGRFVQADKKVGANPSHHRTSGPHTPERNGFGTCSR